MTYRGDRRGVERLSTVRRLRRDQTDAERKLWALLRGRQLAGAKFRRQHELGPYVLDFYAAAQRVCVEADGGQHFHGDEERRDVERDGYLAARGIRVLRFSNADIVSRRDSVMAAILEALGTPSP